LDEAELRGFVETGYPRLVAAVTLVCDSRPAAEDAVQEALARAWERTERGEHIDSLQAWVTTVSLNLARSGVRRVLAERRARGRIDAPGPVPDAADAIDVRRALAQLSRRQREVTVLRYYAGLDTAEIAAVLGVSEGTVKTQLHRAREHLAVALADDATPTTETSHVRLRRA
jgi:RNA polymerase sigma-70 factor (ECF subfamily)